MAIQVVHGYDSTGSSIAHLPADAQVVAGYVTGTGGVPWTAEDFARFPEAIRIDQTPAHTVWDATADIDDFESGAVELGELAPRARVRLSAYHAGVRPGQRSPAVYVSRANVPQVVNALIEGGLTSGIGLYIAEWDGDLEKAQAEVANSAGPFPVIGRQYAQAGAYDQDVFSVPWLESVSVAKPPPPPGQWNDPRAWTWEDITVVGTGLDGKLHMFRLEGNRWVKTA